MTQVTSQKVGERTAEKMSLQTTSKNSMRGRCRRDVTSQFVPDTSSSDRKSLVADSRQPCTTNDQWWWWRWAKTTSSVEVRRPVKLISELWWRCPGKRQDSEVVLDSLKNLQPMQSGGEAKRLSRTSLTRTPAWQQGSSLTGAVVQQNARQCGVAAVQPWPDQGRH